MLTGEFTVKRVQQLRPRIQELVDGFLDRMINQGQSADLVRAYALPAPSMVISLLLGVPYEDHEYFQHHSEIMLSQGASGEEKEAAINAFYRYMLDLVARKEREPDDGLLSRLVHERVATGELSRETAALNGMTLHHRALQTRTTPGQGEDDNDDHDHHDHHRSPPQPGRSTPFPPWIRLPERHDPCAGHADDVRRLPRRNHPA